MPCILKLAGRRKERSHTSILVGWKQEALEFQSGGSIVFLFLFFLRFYLFIFRQGKGRREREKNISVWLPVTCCTLGNLALHPRHVPWLGIEPIPLCFAVWCSIHWATPARAFCLLFLQATLDLFVEWKKERLEEVCQMLVMIGFGCKIIINGYYFL